MYQSSKCVGRFLGPPRNEKNIYMVRYACIFLQSVKATLALVNINQPEV